MEFMFRELKIEMERFGADKGTLKGTLEIAGQSAALTLNLPHDLAARILKCAAPEIASAARSEAAKFADGFAAAVAGEDVR